jgi:sulfate transport system substrate-binding protein
MRRLSGFCLAGLILAGLIGCSGKSADPDTLLNVSYDPTRELWKDLNEQFQRQIKEETGRTITIKQSHGGASSQARAVVEGLEADVVTLALWYDVDAIRRAGLIEDDWQDRLPHRSLPYYSTIVFVVRKGNPKKIRDWPDLVRSKVEIVTPNPKMSGNGQLSLLAAWASVIRAGGSEAQAQEFVTQLYQRVPVLDTGARGATVTFGRGIGDVHLTWENEAHLEVEEAKGNLEIVYPKTSIKAEPFVAVVDDNVRRAGTRELAEKYLKFVYTDEAQEILAQHHYRPISESVLKKYRDRFPSIDLVPITDLAKDWAESREKFFGKRGVYQQVLEELKERR